MYSDTSELDKAWDIYYGVCGRFMWSKPRSHLFVQVFKKVEKQLPQLTTLDLQYVSPSLLKARNLELAVPGNTHYLLLGPSSLILCNQAPTKVGVR